MRRYIFHKLKTGTAEVIGVLNVETDALANIDNFVVTHVHGELDWQEMIHEGLDIRFGMTMQKKEFFDLAVVLDYRLYCYEDNQLLLNESIRTHFKPEYLNFSLKQFDLNVAYDEATYEMYVSPKVKISNPFESVKQSMPLVVVYPMYSSYNDGKPGITGENTAFFGFNANGVALRVKDTPLSISQTMHFSVDNGNLAAGLKSGVGKEENCMLFSLTSDLGLLSPKKVTNLTVTMDIHSVFPPFYTKTIILNPNII